MTTPLAHPNPVGAPPSGSRRVHDVGAARDALAVLAAAEEPREG